MTIYIKVKGKCSMSKKKELNNCLSKMAALLNNKTLVFKLHCLRTTIISFNLITIKKFKNI